MASQRARSYAQFNFLVDFGDDVGHGPHAGFQEVSGFAADVPASERRQNAPAHDSITKLTGINKSVDIIMKRGVVDSTELNSWLDDIKNGGKKGTRTVVIRRHSEDGTAVAQSWKLVREPA